jgi:membrane protein
VSRNADLLEVLRSVAVAARSEQITFLAASLAYYAFVSMLPLLLLALAVGSAIGGAALASRLVSQLGTVLSPSGQQLVIGVLTDASGRGGATVFGVLVLLWGGLKLFRGLDVAFASVYGRETSLGFLQQVKDALVTLLAVAAGVGVTVAAGLVVSLARVPLVGIVGTLATTAGLTLTFLPLYVLLPNPRVPVRDAIPGAVLAAGGWTILGTGFRIYAANAGGFQLYGVVGGVLLLVTWFYFGGIVLLLGVVLNAVLANRAGLSDNRQLQQVSRRRGAQPMTDEHGDRDPSATGERADDGDHGEAAGDRHPTDEDIAQLRAELEEMEDRTVHRDEIERELKQYVRRRVRRGHATGWGPYLVLLYGTAMTLGAFSFLSGGWAILAMLIVWLSTLGLYALMLVVGITVTAAGLPGRLRDAVGNFRR